MYETTTNSAMGTTKVNIFAIPATSRELRWLANVFVQVVTDNRRRAA